MPSITIVSGPNDGDYYPLGRRVMVVVDDLVSRKHAQIRWAE